MDKTVTIILGAILTVLSATGLITADESTSLLSYASSVVVGGIGLYDVIKSIIKRRKEKKDPKTEEK